MKVDVVLPVFNEEKRLIENFPKLHRYLTEQMHHEWRIVIVNNGSTDDTQAIANNLKGQFAKVFVLRLPQKGRGGALREAWLASEADILTYMDIDLSTDLAAFLPLISSLLVGKAEIAIGSRLLPTSQVQRSARRELISRVYIRLTQFICGVRCSDTQCGFKGVSRAVARMLLPEITDNGWFFDTELIIRGQRRGCRITEIPVTWREDRDTRVKICKTVLEDLKGLYRLRNFYVGDVKARTYNGFDKAKDTSIACW
jgi:glycosyltransferase involved in cell wall biosynthesis